MPELPEVETTRQGLLAALEGQILQSVEARVPALRFPLPPDLAARLTGRLVTEAALIREESRGAHFRLDFSHSLPEWQRYVALVK